MTAPQTSRPVPSHVELAANLTRALAALILLNGILSIVGQKDVTIVTKDGEELENSMGGFTAVFSFALPAGIAIALFFLAQGLLKGNQTVRVVTYVLTGLFLACSLCGTGTSFLMDADVYGVPTWYSIWQWIGAVGTLGLSIAVIVLISTPAANAYFAPAPLAPPPGAGTQPLPSTSSTTETQSTPSEKGSDEEHSDSDNATDEEPPSKGDGA